MFGDSFKAKYHRELNELASISAKIREEHGRRGFLNAYPKTCLRCQQIFANADEFYKRTKSLMPANLASQQTFSRELRQCNCGATMVSLSMSDRRNMTEAGARRRALFQEWIELIHQSGQAPANYKQELRDIFRMYEDDRVPS